MTPKRPRDPNQLAKSIIDIATGQKPDRDPTPEEQGKDPAAVALGKRQGAGGRHDSADLFGFMGLQRAEAVYIPKSRDRPQLPQAGLFFCFNLPTRRNFLPIGRRGKIGVSDPHLLRS